MPASFHISVRLGILFPRSLSFGALQKYGINGLLIKFVSPTLYSSMNPEVLFNTILKSNPWTSIVETEFKKLTSGIRLSFFTAKG